MQPIKSSEVIMKKIRNANLKQIDNHFKDVDLEKSIYSPIDEDIVIAFASELNSNGGTFVFCSDEKELLTNLIGLANDRKWDSFFTKDPKIKKVLQTANLNTSHSDTDLLKSQNGITSCEALVARLGSVLISSKQSSGRKVNFFPNTHIVIADTSMIVPSVKDALELVNTKYDGHFPSMTSLITGPSRTADIEKTLVMGMHGPRELIVFLLDEPLK
ncbi:MAG: lactate utilization protein [Bacteroidales bacterium]|nr:lactate utilization protein [Bacteroidales bacterium]